MSVCSICKNDQTEMLFSAKVLNKYEANYFYCKKCGFLYIDNPCWLEEAYSSAINMTDTGILSRNIYLSKVVSSLIYFCLDRNGRFLDYGGGYGIFTRLMRDVGFDYYWSDSYSKNLVSRGFEAFENEEKYELTTCIEVFEHLPDPMVVIRDILSLSENLFFTTELLPESIPAPRDWWYYGLEHGQHISFFSRRTLEYIAQEFDLNLYSIGYMHLLAKKKLNAHLLSLLFKASKFGLSKYVNVKMQSKTFEDMMSIKSLNMEK